MNHNPKKNILLFQLFSNGDCLYATTIARQIKKDFPGCRLTWAIADFCKGIIAGNPDVDETLIVRDVPKADIVAFRKLKKKYLNEKRQGKWDEVFITQNMDENQALYDGTIRGMVLRAYPFPLTVPVEPVLCLSEPEQINVAYFAKRNKLESFKNVILWEYAPQSGQMVLLFDMVMKTALRITSLTSTCVLLSSASAFDSAEKIIDASELSVREIAALTHYCNLLIGCSSGITWLNTSNAASHLPMLQLLNADTVFLNAPSVDFQRNGLPVENLIEILRIDEQKIFNCVKSIIEKGFPAAKKQYNELLPLNFNTTRKIVYNMLCYLQFKAIAKHYRITTSIYGNHPLFLKQFWLAIVTFPIRLVGNLMGKRKSLK